MNWYKKAQSNPNDIMWDSLNGIGSTPNNQNVDYKGWREFMSPSEFRQLALPGVSNEPTANFAIQAVKQGKKFGQPMLYLEWLENENSWIVTSHEGRSRSIAFEKLFPGSPMEVHIISSPMRGANVTPEMKNAPKLSESINQQREDMENEKYEKELKRKKDYENKLLGL